MPIEPTEVSGKFFVAAFLDNSIDGSDFVVGVDQSGSPLGRSWLNSTDQINPESLGNLVPVDSPQGFGASMTEVMVRAVSEKPVAVPGLNGVGYAIYISLLLLLAAAWLRRSG